MRIYILIIFLIIIGLGCFESSEEIIPNTNPFDIEYQDPFVIPIRMEPAEDFDITCYMNVVVRVDSRTLERVQNMGDLPTFETYLIMGNPSIYDDRPISLKVTNLEENLEYKFKTDYLCDFPPSQLCLSFGYRFYDINRSPSSFWDDTFIDSKKQSACFEF